MKIAVTGASGFIGRYVINALLAEKVEIYAITRNASKLANLDKSINVIEFAIDDCDANVFEKIGTPDALIHLAWDGLPNYKSLHHFETELPKQYMFLKRLIDGGLASLFVAGTCFEYGSQSGALSADMETKPNNPYGYAKDALRKQLEFLKAVNPFNLTWARLFYMYGENQPNTSLYPKLLDAVKRGDKAFNMSGGEQLRDYLPVKEVASQIVNLALAQRDAGPVNICSGKPISVREQVEKWLLENNWKIELNLGFYPYPDYEPMEFWGDRQHLDLILDKI
jgi:nucleoside-diphosphate-sugar epimerase